MSHHRMPTGSIRLPAACRAEIARHVMACAPLEACGLLGGVGNSARDVYPVRNVSAQPDQSFYMDPQEQFDAMQAIEKHGGRIVAIYHSHPPGCHTDLSETDLALAFYPESALIVVVPSSYPNDISLRAFYVKDKAVAEIKVRVV